MTVAGRMRVKVERSGKTSFCIGALTFGVVLPLFISMFSNAFDVRGNVHTVDLTNETPPIYAGLLWLVVILCAILLSYLIAIIVYEKARWRVIRSDHPVCPKCRYNLTGNTSGICPECGSAI